MLRIDQDFLPPLERNLNALANSQGNDHLQPQVAAFLDWFRTRYQGRVYTTLETLSGFQRDIGAPDAPPGTPQAILDRLEDVRQRVIPRRLLEFEGMTAAVDANPAEIGDPATHSRLSRLDAAERTRALREIAQDYLAMMNVVSPEALATALSLPPFNQIAPDEYQQFIGIISRMIRPGAAPAGGGSNRTTFLNMDPELLNAPGIRDYVIRVLTRVAYKRLQERADGLATRDALFDDIEAQTHRALRAHALRGMSERQADDLAPLFGDIAAFFKDTAHLARTEIPALTRNGTRMFPDRLNDHQGQPHPFLSLRQLIAVRNLVPRSGEQKGTPAQYTCFRPGDGKTAVPFVAWELRNAHRALAGQDPDRLLYLLETHTMYDIANQVRYTGQGEQVRRFYADGTAPETGIIHSSINGGTRQARFDAALRAPVVFASVTMLGSDHRGRSILAHLQDMKPKYVVVDESQEVVNGGGPEAKDVRSLLLGAGARQMLSGTPAGVKGLRGAIAALEQLEDHDPQHQGIDALLAAADRNTVYVPAVAGSMHLTRGRMERLLTLDQPRDYAPHWTMEAVPVPPNHPQQLLIQRHINTRRLDFGRKYHAIMQAARAPWLAEPGTESLMLNRVEDLLAQELPNNRVILVTEEEVAQGVFREHDVHTGEIVRERMERFVRGLGADFEYIFGPTTQAQRRLIRDRMEASARGEGNRIVVLAQSECIRTGIDLRSATLMIRMGPHWNMDAIEQEFCRMFRGGHLTPRLIMVYLDGGMEAVKLEIAHQRSRQTRRVLHGDNLSERQLQQLLQSEDQMMRRGRLAMAMMPQEERAEHFAATLHNRTAERVAGFWERHEPDWRSIHLDNADRSGIHPLNMQRLTHAVVARLEADGVLGDGAIIHAGTSGLSLARMRKRAADPSPRPVIGVEPKQFMLDAGMDALADRTGVTPLLGSALDLDAATQAAGGEAACAVVEHLNQYKWRTPAAGRRPGPGERLRALLEARDAARTVVLPIAYDALTPAQYGQFVRRTLPLLGLQVLTRYSGVYSSTENAGEQEWRGYVVVAQRMDGPMPAQARVVRRLSQTDLVFTHGSTLRTHEQNRFGMNAHRHRRLPYPLIHSRFAAGSTVAATGENPPHRLEQERHLDVLTRAVTQIRTLAPTVADWQATGGPARAALAAGALGIVYYGNPETPTFYLRDFPEHFFYPYDEVWNPTA